MKAKMPNNIKKYKTKFAAGLTGLQLIMLAVGLAVGSGLFCLLFLVANWEINICCILSIIIAFPFVAVGFVKMSGLNFLQIVTRFWNDTVHHANYRPLKMRGVGRDE